MNIVIYGGTFSPPHNGHINAVKALLRNVSSDMFVIMPTGIPPHKDEWGNVCGDDRFAMCKAAFEPVSDAIEVSDYEIKKGSKSYTYETIRHYKELYPEASIMLLCGEDMIMSLDSWYNAHYLMKECSFAAVSRRLATSMNEKIKYLEKRYGAKIKVIECTPVEISSQQIRKMICEGRYISDCVPSGVLKIIKEKKLYSSVMKG